MMTKTKASQLCRFVYVYVLPSAILLSAGAPAQQVPTEADDSDEETIEEILVTGSRLRQDPLEARNPIQVLTYEDFERSGDVNFAEYLQRLPANGSAINRTNNSSGNLVPAADGSGYGAGSVQIDLRYLQAKRTLVLVDGRRWVRNSSASGVGGSIDLNTIPQNAIESIEVLLDGASTIYGSDAIGGVVNIITKSDYDGVQASAYYGQYGEGDGTGTNFEFSVGSNSDRSRILAAIAFTDQEGVLAADREISRFPLPGFESGLSSWTPQGVWFFTNELGKFVGVTLNDGVVNSGASNGGLPVYDPANPASGDFHAFTLADRYNWQPPNAAITPSRRVSAFVKGEYDVASQVTARFMAAFTNRESRSQAAPNPISFGPGSGGDIYTENVVIPADQEYNPFGVQLGGADGITSFFMARRAVELGPRIFEQGVNTSHVSGGLDGTFEAAGNDWYWDVTAGLFKSDAVEEQRGFFDSRNVVLAAGPAGACAAVPGCVPINLFGGQEDGSGSLTQEMLEFISIVPKNTSQQEMLDVSANISGSLFDLPAGPLGIAAGIEYREENGFFRQDDLLPTNRDTAGGYDVLEYYAETIVPIFSEFDLSGAIRASDYDLFGSTSVIDAGARWRPVDTLTLRANFSEGFRAPNIGELFNPVLRTLFPPLVDLCSGATGQTASNCEALGVPPGFATEQPALIPREFGGNQGLVPENSENYTVGFTWDASDLVGVERFVVEANYYNIDVTDAVDAPIPENILNSCIATLDRSFCDLVTRAPSGVITRIDARINNIAAVETNGVDLRLVLTTPEYGIGRFHFDWISNFLLEYTERDFDSSGNVVLTSREGTELGAAGRGYPELKSVLVARLERDNWSAGITATYIGELTEPCAGLTASFGFLPGVLDLCDNPGVFRGPFGTNTIDDRFYLDIQASFRPGWINDAMEITFGLQNAMDQDPPVCRSCTINGFNGTLYRFPGRSLYARLSYSPE